MSDPNPAAHPGANDPSPPPQRGPRTSRWPFFLLGFMTLFSVGGPLLFGWVLAGGDSPRWPPDRPVEWATLFVISGGVLVLMLSCTSLAIVNRKALQASAQAAVEAKRRAEASAGGRL